MSFKTTILVAVLTFALASVCLADLSTYSQDFEGLNQADPAALTNDGWLVFANVFSPDHSTFFYNYGPFPAPNGGPAFSAVGAGEGGAGQGAQQLVAYNDYNNGDHNNGFQIEANLFQEQIVGAGDVGKTWVFEFDAKRGDLAAPTAAIAFIKTLDLVGGTFGLIDFIAMPADPLPTTWGTYSLSLLIHPGLAGQILQIGFANTTTGFTPSGMVYDNINFDAMGPVSVEETSWGSLKSLYR